MRNIYKVLGIALFFLLLQSCFVAKEYEAPESVVQEGSFRSDSVQTDTTTLADVSWEEMFTDPILQGHIEHALVNNIDIRVAIQQILAAEAFVKQGKAGFWPSVNGSADYTRSYPSKNGLQGATSPDHFNQYDLEANLSWEADIWGRIRSQKRAFDASYLRTLAAHQAVKTQLIASIASSYYRLLALDKQVEITKETIETRKTSWETTKKMKEAGVSGITSTAVQQTEAQYLDAQALLINLQKESRILENTICILMGDEPHPIERASLDDQEIATDLEVGVPAQLLSNRPDVVAAEDNYRRTFELTNVARANFYPSFTIGANAGFQSLKFKNWFDGHSLFGNIIGGLTAPIFNQRQIRTQYEVAQTQQETARLDYRNALIQASKEVSDALYSYKASTKMLDIKIRERDLLTQAVDDSQQLMKSGYNNFSYLEVLTAQESVLNSSLDVVNERLTQLNSVVDLYQAVGGGWR